MTLTCGGLHNDQTEYNLHNDQILLLILNLYMETFRAGIKVEFKIIQYVYAYVISHKWLHMWHIYAHTSLC